MSPIYNLLFKTLKSKYQNLNTSYDMIFINTNISKKRGKRASIYLPAGALPISKCVSIDRDFR
jgi:hypothetical protein